MSAGTGLYYQSKLDTRHVEPKSKRLKASTSVSVNALQSSAMPDNTWIVYTHPKDRHNKANRKRIASYIGTHYRNRSKPAARKAMENANLEHSQTASQTVALTTKKRERPLKRYTAHSIPRDAHGLREDPFANYLVTKTDCVPGAIDYFIHFFAPTHVIRPDLVPAENSKALIKDYFQYAVSNPMLFDAIIALSQINLSANKEVSSSDGSGALKTPDKDALVHYGQALKNLREVITNGEGLKEDAVLFAIATLMGVDVRFIRVCGWNCVADPVFSTSLTI
jgi:hypothetical protein